MLCWLSQFFSSLSLVTKVVLAIGILVLSNYVWKSYRRIRETISKIEKIPGPPVPSFLLGHLFFLWQKTNTGDWFQQIFNTFVGFAKIYKQSNVGFVRFWIGPTQPVVVIFDADCAETVLTSNVNIDKSREFDFAKPWLGLGLFTSTGDKWRAHRKMLTPAFHFRILESFIPIINKQQKIMMNVIETRMKNTQGVINDVRSLTTNCALDIICETAMGVSIEAQTSPESTYSKTVRRVLDLFTIRFLSPWLWNDFIFSISPTGREQKKLIKYLHNFTESVIKKRQKEITDLVAGGKSGEDLTRAIDDFSNKRVLAFLDSLLMQNVKNPNTFSDEDIRCEVDTFMSAGQDTSSVTLQFALQLIGHHKDVQDQIHEELDAIFSDDPSRDIRFEDLREMKYLEKCVKETLRIFPPVIFIARNITEEFEIKGKTIPVGTTCLVLFHQLHRDSKYFLNSEKFDPERFAPEKMSGRHAFTYTPFSAGPRNCIGQRFAMLTVKALLASILRKYRIKSLVPMDKVELAIGTTVGQKNKVTIQFEQRFQ